MAFVGPNAHLRRCNSIRKGVRCRRERYDAKGKPLRQYTTLPVLPRVRASFAAGKGSTHLHQTAELADQQWDTDAQRFKDWGWGAVHRNFRENGMFMDDRHDAFLLSVDGAQMVDNKRKSSNGWIVLLSSFNTPQLARFKRDEAFIATVIPGPNNPVNIDSFLWPVFEEFARAAKGFWIWDAARAEWFLWRAWIIAAAADQQGSSKISKMTGPTGYSGCRTCHMVANYAYPGQTVGHFPLKTIRNGDPERAKERLIEYDPYDLPMRSDDTYEEDLQELGAGRRLADRRETKKLTGVGGRPLLSFSPAFTIPTFFPPDVFHLFGSNVPSLLWKTLT
ncbi:hypothetical protein CF319_g9624, partial [Tilletia indica]